MSASVSLSLRISPKDRNLIDRGATAANKSRSEFLLDSARAAATDALLDQRLFMLSVAQMKAFELALNKAPAAAEISQHLRKRSIPWKA